MALTAFRNTPVCLTTSGLLLLLIRLPQMLSRLQVIAVMEQKQSKIISAQSKKNPKRSEEVEVPVECRESDPERLSAVLQLSEERLDEVKVSLEDMMDESEGSGAELLDINEIQGTLDLILLENTEVAARMDRKVAALEGRLRELEEAAQAISAVIAVMEQKQSKIISAQSKKNPKRSEEVEVPVECRESDPERLSAVLQLSEERLDEVKVSLEDMMDESEGSGAELLDINEIQGTLDLILLENTEVAARMDRKVAALEYRTRELEEAAQAISAEKAKLEQRLAALLETFDKRALVRTEIARADFELKLAAMSKKVDYLVQEKANDKAEYERRLAAMYETIDRRVLERTENGMGYNSCMARVGVSVMPLILLLEDVWTPLPNVIFSAV